MALTRRDTLKQGSAIGMTAFLATACSGQNTEPTDINKLDGVGTANAIKNKDITAAEAVDAAISRAEAMNPQINAIVTKTFEAAREQAATIYSPKNRTDKNRIFAGVPTFIKDLINVAGVPTQGGSRSLSGFTPDTQYPFVDDFMDTGLISLGKSTTPEFGLTATTEPKSSGQTRNPWNLAHSTGGSSGGAAALVASGVVPFAHASDGGGSIRIPASCCGLIGLKPSRDRFHPVRDENQTPVRISVQGIESRTVRDSAAFLAAMEIATPKSPLQSVGMVTGPNKKRLKIAYMDRSLENVPLHEDVKNSTDKVAQLCTDLGHEVVPFPYAAQDPKNQIFSVQFLLYWAGIAAAAIADWENSSGLKASEDYFEPLTLGLRDHFAANQNKVQQAIFDLIGFNRVYASWFENVDLILSPVLTLPPVKLGYLDTSLDYDLMIKRVVDYAQFTAFANVSGAPALSLPLGMSQDNLPIGAQFQAPLGNERTLLELAYELEESQPWQQKTPPLFAG